MKLITKDEMYNWMPCKDRAFADAQIPDDLHQSLCDAITQYNKICSEIYKYFAEHQDDEFRI